MTEDLFNEAKLLYELFPKRLQQLDEVTLSKLSPLIGLSKGTEDLLARLHRLMSGLPAEDEFMAIAVWMEQCKLIHKLEQEQLPSTSRNNYQVPDLFAIFNYYGRDIPALVEVKVSNEPRLQPKLRFSEQLYKKLTSYAKINNLPLLIAWKIRGHWSLFDIREMQKHESAYHINMESAMKADLMFSLLGNINIVAMPGTHLTMSLEDLGLTKKISDSEEVHQAKIQGLRVYGKNGKDITKMNTAEWLLFLFSDHEEKQNRRGDIIDMNFYIVDEPSMIPAYALLAFRHFGFHSTKDHLSNWYNIVRDENFGDFPYSRVRKAMEASIGKFVQYVFQVLPHNVPDFLTNEI